MVGLVQAENQESLTPPKKNSPITKLAWLVALLWCLRNILYFASSKKKDSKELKPSRKHWCVLAKDQIPLSRADYFIHFPHCMELALPCWSWFRENNATNNCGFLLVGGLSLNATSANSWQKQLIQDHMKCDVQFSEQAIPPNDEDNVYQAPNLKWLRPRYGYRNYLKDPEDAQALRRAVGVSDEWVATQKGNGKPLQIGVIQRSLKRVVTNLNDTVKALELAIPDANITYSTLEEARTVHEQAKWFASKDVIIASHGAALTNSVFITRGTFVLQLYPPNFHWQSLDPLIEQSGGIALDWYEGIDPIKAWKDAGKDHRIKNKAQHGDFQVPPQEVVDILLVALGRKQPSQEMIAKSKY